MNLLIVDDEALSVEGIAASLPWETMQISQIFKAYSMKQAQSVFLSHTVDILLCDIEMPRGSGIELMEWIRREGYHPVCIFLTCYSNFDYASNAVRLQMFDYILKPCEYEKLAAAIKRAVARRIEDTVHEKQEQMAKYWEKDEPLRIAALWNDILLGDLSSDPHLLERELNWRHLPFTLLERFYHLFYLQLIPSPEMAEWKGNAWKYAIKNVIEELLDTRLVLVWEKTFLAISDAGKEAVSVYEKNGHKLIHTLQSITPAKFLGYLYTDCTMPEAHGALQALKKDAREKYALRSTLFVHGRSYELPKAPDFSSSRWMDALFLGKEEQILNDIRHYLSCTNMFQYIDRSILSMICRQLQKVLYDALRSCQLSSAAEDFLHSTEDQLHSIPDFLSWAKSTVEQTALLIRQKEQSTSAGDTLLHYIREHLSSDLSRAELAEIVHLHPDYLSTVFRRQTGKSLSEFITAERIALAKRLLLTTDLPINEIAIRTGFQTITYFSRQFKRFEKLTPLQYRKRKGLT